MRGAKRVTWKVLSIILGLIAMALLWFVVGFIGGYIFWFPTLKAPRIEQAFNVGLFVAGASFIIDPVLYFTWTSYFKRKKGDDA